MNNNLNQYILIIVALTGGLAAGKFMFSKNSDFNPDTFRAEINQQLKSQKLELEKKITSEVLQLTSKIDTVIQQGNVVATESVATNVTGLKGKSVSLPKKSLAPPDILGAKLESISAKEALIKVPTKEAGQFKKILIPFDANTQFVDRTLLPQAELQKILDLNAKQSRKQKTYSTESTINLNQFKPGDTVSVEYTEYLSENKFPVAAKFARTHY